ncbi:MAG: RDD family protein [Mycobacteriaceae bacterium]
MVDRKDVGSWLNGPGAVRPDPDPEDYPGRRLGMPEQGPGSLARFGRRAVALCVDWFVCTVIAAGLMHYRLGEGGLGPFKPLAVFVVMNLLLVGTLGATIGHRLLGIRVVRLGGATAGPLLGAIRTVLLALVVPAVIWDRDTRGYHDKIAGTVTTRA